MIGNDDKKSGPITYTLNRVIHERARLGIMTKLMAEGESDFTALKKSLSLSDGNLNAHLKVLLKNEYVLMSKEFVANKPRTTYRITEKGKLAFKEYVNSLEKFLKSVSQEENVENGIRISDSDQ
jgi:DNA-binding HxlR family transcriptional regulator